MKKIALTIAVLFSISISNIWAEGNGVNDVNEVKGTNNTTVRTIKAPRFARPLVEKWIKEYAKTQPGVEFQIAKGQGNSDLNVQPCCLSPHVALRQPDCSKVNT